MRPAIAAEPITVLLGGNNDIVIAQLHDNGRSGVFISTSSMQTPSPAAILTLAKDFSGR
jgi:hypothetical protein